MPHGHALAERTTFGNSVRFVADARRRGQRALFRTDAAPARSGIDGSNATSDCSLIVSGRATHLTAS
jgi:hypothetical protein